MEGGGQELAASLGTRGPGVLCLARYSHLSARQRQLTHSRSQEVETQASSLLPLQGWDFLFLRLSLPGSAQ